MALLKGWRYAAFIGSIVGAIGVTLYPIIIYPMTHIEEYSKNIIQFPGYVILNYVYFLEELQKANRRGIIQEQVQPGSEYCNFFIMQQMYQVSIFCRYESVVRSI